MRSDDLSPEIFLGPPLAGGKARFSKPNDFDVGEFLDYIEDMSLLLGCPNCRSFKVQESRLAGKRVQICDDCGQWVEIPPVN